MDEAAKAKMIRDYYWGNASKEELIERAGLNKQKFTQIIMKNSQRVVDSEFKKMSDKIIELEEKLSKKQRQEENIVSLYLIIKELSTNLAEAHKR